MTVERFCESERVSRASFYQWRNKLAAGNSASETPPAFQQVVLTPALPMAALRVRLASGAELEVGPGNLELVRVVVGELARAECLHTVGEDAAC